MKRPTKNGWSVLIEEMNQDGTKGKSSTVTPPTRFWWLASRTLRTRPKEWTYERRTLVDHDAEMRRWNYDMGIIEPTPQERAGLPVWHDNYETIPPRTPKQREFDDRMVADFRVFNKAHGDRTGVSLTWHQWIEHVTGDKQCRCASWNKEWVPR